MRRCFYFECDDDNASEKVGGAAVGGMNPMGGVTPTPSRGGRDGQTGAAGPVAGKGGDEPCRWWPTAPGGQIAGGAVQRPVVDGGGQGLGGVKAAVKWRVVR